MSKSARKYLIAGNWKMNLNSAEGADLAKDVVSIVGAQTDVAVCVCTTFTALESVSKVVNDSNVQLGAQNMHFEASGAYTGEISAEMLRHLFCNFVILGHSERREYFGETDALVNKKTLAALAANLKPIVCIGETLDEREAGKVNEVIKTQLEGALVGVTAANADALVVAYEPVWAIGTGKTATPEMAEEVHAEIRCLLAGLIGEEAAEKVRILYGGSMKPGNAPELLAQKNIDGGLIGGAALKANDFAGIIEAAVALSK
ncbi:MAG: triose-phosphate isomerase [Opitutales bacterium]|jgi:triosephosphate isomerase (TIM)|nr:triose-phosphate isomerase [Opitutales bacterium]MDP4643654.1 triose-phosphate isomerase [Opitutales bacterium]MDP4776797.1 triose-phosphate isomerase [Opitutales bacterium]MDP4884587.1 triose-phosphate isomerase [Opitutales bacterium]MDP5079564.1 triose-phosphate isomerase [Opitutales bacterium]